MDDLLEEPGAGNTPEFTVSEISGALKRVIEGEFGRVRVRGEVGRVYQARSGHLYFDIKDDRNVLASVTWKGQISHLSARPEEGMEVVAIGKLTTFGSQSKYQLNVEDLTPAGEGALMAMLEKRKKLLAAEGLFDEALKQPLPYLPEVIGVVTSPTGAVIRDILHRLRDRFPRKVLVWPVAVQGQACAPQVAAAIDGFNQLTPGGALPRPDLLIVARGGGSIEDLWGFNEESVARAAAASRIPLISAVGHETDTTLIDYVSDKRAPTPTAAAEMAVPVRSELLAWVQEAGGRMTRSLGTGVGQRQQRLSDLGRALPRPETLTAERRQKLDMLEAQLPVALRDTVWRRRQGLAEAGAGLRSQAMRDRIAARRLDLRSAERRLSPALDRRQSDARRALEQLVRALDLGIGRAVQAQRDGLDRDSERLSALVRRWREGADRRLDPHRKHLAALERMRESLGYKETLRRGFAVVRDGAQVITTPEAARQAGALEIEFAAGTVTVDVGSDAGRGEAKQSTPVQPKPKRTKSPDSDSGQGSLF